MENASTVALHLPTRLVSFIPIKRLYTPVLLLLFSLLAALSGLRELVLHQGWNPRPLQWKRRVLTTAGEVSILLFLF